MFSASSGISLEVQQMGILVIQFILASSRNGSSRILCDVQVAIEDDAKVTKLLEETAEAYGLLASKLNNPEKVHVWPPQNPLAVEIGTPIYNPATGAHTLRGVTLPLDRLRKHPFMMVNWRMKKAGCESEHFFIAYVEQIPDQPSTRQYRQILILEMVGLHCAKLSRSLYSAEEKKAKRLIPAAHRGSTRKLQLLKHQTPTTSCLCMTTCQS
ncbi:MAG: hypothetical protein L6R40_001099 [Gallowayella cf. fulva]|nr:MAG: hypothetical protein L6R40_001099 [Xanthomendoza cf. fulva]